MARHQFSVLFLACLALLSSFWFLLDVLSAATHRAKTFGVASFEDRFKDFRKAVQPFGVYGYVSDNPPNDASNIAEYHLTQYTLVPAVIKPSADASLIILNYHSKQLDPGLLRNNHLNLVQDFGNGVALCRRAAQ